MNDWSDYFLMILGGLYLIGMACVVTLMVYGTYILITHG